MTQQNETTTQTIHPAPVGNRMMQGAAIALILVILFLLLAGKPSPEWPKLWMIKPLVMVPVAGAVSGVFYYFMDHLRSQGAGKKLGIISSLVGYIIVLWPGTVLGLNGTMWD